VFSAGAIIILRLFAVGLAPGLLTSVVCWKRARIPIYYYLLLALPLIVWDVLSRFMGPGGSLANLVNEPLILGFGMSVILIARLVWPGSEPSEIRRRFLVSIALCIAVALAIVLFFPELTE
jgi:hypothetical protein